MTDQTHKQIIVSRLRDKIKEQEIELKIRNSGSQQYDQAAARQEAFYAAICIVSEVLT